MAKRKFGEVNSREQTGAGGIFRSPTPPYFTQQNRANGRENRDELLMIRPTLPFPNRVSLLLDGHQKVSNSFWIVDLWPVPS